MYSQQIQPDPTPRRRFWAAAWWAGAFIWAGIVLLADNIGALPEVEGANVWSWTLTGAGVYALVLDVWRTVSPREPSPDGGDLFWTGVLLVLGLAGFFGFDIALPVILIVIGVVLVLRAFVPHRRAPRYVGRPDHQRRPGRHALGGHHAQAVRSATRRGSRGHRERSRWVAQDPRSRAA